MIHERAKEIQAAWSFWTFNMLVAFLVSFFLFFFFSSSAHSALLTLVQHYDIMLGS